MLIYTDYVNNSEIKRDTSYLFIGIYVFNMLVNLFVVFYHLILAIKFKIKKAIWLRRVRMMNKIRKDLKLKLDLESSRQHINLIDVIQEE